MPAIDDLIAANAAYTHEYPGPTGRRPAARLAVLTCMDSRLDMFDGLGLRIGDAHILRNAGGIPTDDALRSLAISQRAMGTREVAIILHTDCGMDGFDDPAFRAELARESGLEPPWRVDGYTDLHADARAQVQRVRECPWLPHRDAVRGFVWDVATAALTEV